MTRDAVTAWAVAGGIATVVLLLSTLPQSDLPLGEHRLRGLDDLAHVVQFCAFAAAACRAALAGRVGRAGAFWLALALTVSLSVLNECIQLFVPTRMFSLHDMAVDALSGAAGALIAQAAAARAVPTEPG